VAQAVGGAPVAVAVEPGASENPIEELDVVAGKDVVRRLRQLRFEECRLIAAVAVTALPLPPALGRDRLRAVEQPLIGPDGTRHPLAEADAVVAAHLDLENPLAGRVVLDNRDIAVLKIPGLIRAKPGVRHEQHKIMHLLGFHL
jgi:hypothetical protein